MPSSFRERKELFMQQAGLYFQHGVALMLFLGALASPGGAATREYFVAAQEVVWDYAPTDQNLVHCDGAPAPCPIPHPWTKSHAFHKVRYIEYTDGSFQTPKPQPVWLGVLGPILRAEVGDTVIVHFCNHATSGAYGMHPHGFRYVHPGACFDYHWIADEDSGPGPGDPSSKVWWYHSHISEQVETNLGLLGPIIITRKGMATKDGSPKDVDQEFVTAFVIFDELEGREEGLMHSINGYIFGNLRGLVAKNGARVRWHLLGMGNEVDLHTPHWHGKTVTIGAPHLARRTDVVELLPASMVTADMQADNPGEWMFHCHVADHIAAGMLTTFRILP
jgi:FtsP/CotA-like multicopper oxidase with cupredoxin domain